MAVEYVLSTSAPVEARDAAAFFATTLKAEPVDESWCRREGMHVTSIALPAEYVSDDLGFPSTLDITFRLFTQVPQEQWNANVVAMTRAVLAFMATFPGDAVLLFNHELVVIQSVGAVVTLDEGWSDWKELPELSGLAAGYACQKLRQPLLE